MPCVRNVAFTIANTPPPQEKFEEGNQEGSLLRSTVLLAQEPMLVKWVSKVLVEIQETNLKSMPVDSRLASCSCLTSDQAESVLVCLCDHGARQT